VVNLVQGGRESGGALLEQPIDGLLFTGLGRGGRLFPPAASWSRPEVILALELGGNNPLVVWGADPGVAAGLAVQSAYVTSGQRCSCARRLIVPDGPKGEAIIEAVRALSERLVIGPWNGAVEPFMGPLISARAAEGAKARAKKLGEGGARVVKPLETLELGPAYLSPALIDVTDMTPPDEEIFAPCCR
jgi:succinylglutamic semialdehyde dehydrogenase